MSEVSLGVARTKTQEAKIINMTRYFQKIVKTRALEKRWNRYQGPSLTLARCSWPFVLAQAESSSFSYSLNF